MTPSAHSPLLTTSMQSGLAFDNLSTPTPASTLASHPASVFRRPLGKPVTAVSRAMEATRGQIKTISTAAKHSVLSNQHSPVSRLASSPNAKPSPSSRSRQPLGARTPSAAVKTTPVVIEKPNSPKQVDVRSSPRADTSETPKKQGSDVHDASAKPSTPESAPPLTQDTVDAVSTAASTPKATGRKAIEGVEIRSETRQAIVSVNLIFKRIPA